MQFISDLRAWWGKQPRFVQIAILIAIALAGIALLNATSTHADACSAISPAGVPAWCLP